MKKYMKYLSAFTLVELIIVITILGILAILAFISLKNYMGNARDGNRIATLTNIEKGLLLYSLKTGIFPMPEKNIQISNSSGDVLINQGEISEQLVQILKINGKITDPEGEKYIYSINENANQYQLGIFLESNDLITYFPQTYANTREDKRYFYTIGNYVGILIDKDMKKVIVPASDGIKLVIEEVNQNDYEIYFPNKEKIEKSQGDERSLVDKIKEKQEKHKNNGNNGGGDLPPAPIVYASCDLNGTTIPHGASITRYETTSVTFGNTCTSEQRSCDNGTLSGSFTNESCSVAGAIGTFTLSNTSVAFGTDVNISNNCSTQPISYTSSNTSVATVSGTTITTLTAGTTIITPVGGACGDNEGKTLTVTTPTCTSFTYSAYGACQPNNAQTRTILTQSPSGCSGGSPDVLEQSCTYVPPVVAWRDISGTSCDNDDYVFTYEGEEYRWAGCNSVLGSGFEWGKQDDGSHGSIGSCYSYNNSITLLDCPIAIYANDMYSTAKEKNWYIAGAVTGTVNNIWGKLYTYAQASSTTNGACPNGWHLPTYTEWEILETYLNTPTKTSPRIKCSSQSCPGLGWLGNASKNSSNNIIQALKIPLAGYRHPSGATFYNRGNSAYLWSIGDITKIFYWNKDTMSHSIYNVLHGFSVRCVKD